MTKNISRGQLQQHWVHSHEEDTASEMVFRPSTYNFPRSRGRQSFELRPDGALVETGIGPTDRQQSDQGTWALEDDDRLVFYTGHRPQPSRSMQIVSAGKDRLVIKK